MLLSLEERVRAKTNALPLFVSLAPLELCSVEASICCRGEKADRIPMFVSPVFQLLKISESVLVGTVRDSNHNGPHNPSIEAGRC